MPRLPALLLTLSLSALGCTHAASAHAAELELDVSGLLAGQGPLMVAAFADPSQWLRKPIAVTRALPEQIRDGRATVRLTDLPDGPVAISLFQDLNGNGRLDTNPVGMPLEPFAFSRQAQGQFGPPKFQDAVLEAGVRRHAIQLPAMP